LNREVYGKYPLKGRTVTKKMNNLQKGWRVRQTGCRVKGDGGDEENKEMVQITQKDCGDRLSVGFAKRRRTTKGQAKPDGEAGCGRVGGVGKLKPIKKA